MTDRELKIAIAHAKWRSDYLGDIQVESDYSVI